MLPDFKECMEKGEGNIGAVITIPMKLNAAVTGSFLYQRASAEGKPNLGHFLKPWLKTGYCPFHPHCTGACNPIAKPTSKRSGKESIFCPPQRVG